VSRQVLHAAVDSLAPPAKEILDASQRWSIVVLGRIFQGRQSKGHEQAIQLFHEVRAKLGSSKAHDKLKLILIGNPMPGQVIGMPWTPPTPWDFFIRSCLLPRKSMWRR
jgi:hypothetical protein